MGEPCRGGGNRRQFLQTTAASGAVLAASGSLQAAPLVEDALPTITLGKTGQKVTRLGMGTSWTVQPSFVQAAIFAGVRYIDTAEGYENGNSERTLGEVLERTGKRKDVYLVTKNSGYRKARRSLGLRRPPEQEPGTASHRLHRRLLPPRTQGRPDPNAVRRRRQEGLRRPQEGRQDPLHRPLLPRCPPRRGRRGRREVRLDRPDHDPVQLPHHDRRRPQTRRRRRQQGKPRPRRHEVPGRVRGRLARHRQEQPQARLVRRKRLQRPSGRHQGRLRRRTLPGRRQRDDQPLPPQGKHGAAVNPLSPKEARLLEEHRQKTANLYCHGCGHLCETAARGVPVSTVMRYLRYYSAYGKREEARDLYQALPAEARDLAKADLEAAEKACPHGLPVVQLIGMADRRLS